MVPPHPASGLPHRFFRFLHASIQRRLPNFARSVIFMKQLQDVVRNNYDTQILNYLTTIILYDIFYQLSPITPPLIRKPVKKNSRKQIYYDILDYVKTNIDKPMKVEDIAFHFGYNEKYISYLFKEHAGIALKQYILNTKIELANFYLSDTNKPIVTIAKELGFNNNRGCKIFCVYGNETFQIRIRYVVVFVGFCSRIFCRIYLSGYSISCPLSFIHAF